jgi:hypothetical protein
VENMWKAIVWEKCGKTITHGKSVEKLWRNSVKKMWKK